MTTHYDWLRLIEVSGPFLSATVLDEAFPTGLDGLDRRVKRELSRFYNEWLEAREDQSSDFADVHQEWCKSVLREGLEFKDGDLISGAEFVTQGEGGIGSFAADLSLTGIDNKPALFVKFLSADVKPSDKDMTDDWKDTYIEKMVRLCRLHGVRLGLITNGEQWVLVNAAPDGQVSGHVTWYARLWFQEDETLRAFIALLGYTRFSGAPKKRLPYLLDESAKHLEEVTDTLGKQVMTAVEVLLEGLDRADLNAKRELLKDVKPAELYEASLTVMMRLVFLLCAEERGLLLLGEKLYDDVYAVSTLMDQLKEDADRFGEEVLERRYDAWARLLATFRAVYGGIDNPELRMAAMGGSLFDPDKYPFLEGREKGEEHSWRNENPAPLPIDNRTVLLLLKSLQLLENANGAIPLSFRSLDVEQIGYIYEGLLEFTADQAHEVLLGLKGDKNHPNPEISLNELAGLVMDAPSKAIAKIQELTGRSAIAREYAAEPDPDRVQKLAKVCRFDEGLKNSVLPFLNWMRDSAWGEPVVYHKDSFFVTVGQDRRSSGAHYTPKQLTEMIVKEALEPVVYVGPAEGKPRNEWILKSPAEILNLKVCDIAMGSGAFLVQACRYLSDRLVDSWTNAEKGGKAIASDGSVTDFPPNDPLSNVPDDRLCEARRLIAEKCLYGVDINPLAVELAKLSLWLVTISKNRPFGFLDHNLKSGDSLLGVTDVKQLIAFRMKPEGTLTGNLLTEQIEDSITKATAEREAIRNARTLDIRDIQLQMQHHENAERHLSSVRAYANYFISEVFVLGKTTDKNGKITKKAAASLDGAAMEGASLLGVVAPRQQDIFADNGDASRAEQARKRTSANLAYDLPAGQTAPRRPFHWALEFPEVFAQGGFDAIVGNPPFMGGQHITGNFGTAYRDYLVNHIADGVKGSADFVAYFYLRVFGFLKPQGMFALIACNTIAEGSTRSVGLDKIVSNGGVIISAHPDMPWPGVAAVVISPVAIWKSTSQWLGAKNLSGQVVPFISTSLTAEDASEIKSLVSNEGQSFQGSIVLGMGFTLSPQEAKELIAISAENRDVVYPYLNGEDLNSDPSQSPSRWVVNFFDWDIKRAEQYSAPFALVDERVRPERELNNDKNAREYWWRFLRPRSELYHAIGRGNLFEKHPKEWTPKDDTQEMILVTARTQNFLKWAIVPSNQVFADRLVLLTVPTSRFAILSSTIFQEWTRKTSTTLKFDINFTPSLTYETFPFPKVADADASGSGFAFDSARRAIMTADQIGLTHLYNKFHDKSVDDPRFVALRELQVKIDNAVRDAYGWTDLDLGHGFHEVGYLPANDNVRYTISEEARIEVLKRLARLNKERWEEEEAAGLHKKGKKK